MVVVVERCVPRLLANDHLMARFVGGLEGDFQPSKAIAIEPEGVGHSIELRALLGGDNAVLDDLGEELFVVALEPAHPEISGDVAALEGIGVLEGRGRGLANGGFGHEQSIVMSLASGGRSPRTSPNRYKPPAGEGYAAFR